MWQLIFMNITTRVKNNADNVGSDISGLPYLLFALPGLFHPLLSVLLFSGLTVYRLCRISGDSVRRKSSGGQGVRATGGGDDTFPYVRGAGTGMMAGLAAHNIAASDTEDYVEDFPNHFSDEHHKDNFSFEFVDVNPATGLNMIGAFDVEGNMYGTSSMDNDHGHHNDSYDYNHDHYYDSEYN